MNIVACYKIVPDEQDAVVAPDRTLSFEKAALKIGDYDLNAVEAGAQLAEQYDAKLMCATVGGAVVEDSKLRKSILARGPEENFAVKEDSLSHAGSTLTARALKGLVEKIGTYDLILCGEGSADLYSQQVGIQLGEMLEIPTINAASSIEIDGSTAKVERSVDGQVETLEVSLPAVISVIADMNTPRIPSMKDILSAGKKPSTMLTAEDIGLSDFTETNKVMSVLAPVQKERACRIAEGEDEETIKAFLATIEEQLQERGHHEVRKNYCYCG